MKDGRLEVLPRDASTPFRPAFACDGTALPMNIREPKSKSIKERFCNGELIPIGEIIQFPAGLPDLLKAA